MEMDRDFEKFLAGPTPPANKRLNVTLNRQNVLILSNNVYQKLGKPEAVCLYYSRARDTIGMVPVSPRMNEALPLKAHAKSGFRINASPFCRHFGIRVDSTIRFVDPEIQGVKMLLKLSHTVGVALQPGRSKKRNS
jgi:hypothetical protein